MRQHLQNHGDKDSIRVAMARSQRTQYLRRISRGTRTMVLVRETVGMADMISNLPREAEGSGVRVVILDGKPYAVSMRKCCEHVPWGK